MPAFAERPISSEGPARILEVGDHPQMCRVDARAVLAEVIDRHTFRDLFPRVRDPCGSVGSDDESVSSVLPADLGVAMRSSRVDRDLATGLRVVDPS